MKKVVENDSEKKNKTMWNSDPNYPVVVVAGILRENRRGGRPGAIVSSSNFQCLTHAGQDHCPTGTSKSGGVRHSKCHPVEQTSQITMVAARFGLPHNRHFNPAEI
jgi:hypothetical protein